VRIVALDLIRFFAALSVVLYHYISRKGSDVFPTFSEVTNYGYLGVPLFFIISGYVIALSANNRTALEFGVSRFIRLYPALWVGVLFTVLIVFIFKEEHYTIYEIAANFTLLNEYLGFKDIDGVYWTLKAELKFYVCIFLLLLFGVFQKYRIWISIWLVMTFIYTIIKQPFFMGWFITPTYSSFFIAGIAFYLIQKEGVKFFNLSVLFLSLIISSFNAYHQASSFMYNTSSFNQFISVVIVWLFYVIFYLLCIGKMQLKSRQMYIVLGGLTYPLYLIHNVAGKVIINHYTQDFSEEVVIFSVIILMIFISLLIHFGIEKKFSSPMKQFLLSKLQRKHKN